MKEQRFRRMEIWLKEKAESRWLSANAPVASYQRKIVTDNYLSEKRESEGVNEWKRRGY